MEQTPQSSRFTSGWIRLPNRRYEIPDGRFKPAEQSTSMDEARQLFETAIAIIPTLTRGGIGLSDRTLSDSKGDPDLIRQKIAEGQAELARHLDEIVASADWCKQQKRRKKINYNQSSYGYKHMVERWDSRLSYVANGAFIAAAVGLGFQHKTEGRRDHPMNAFFNIGKPRPEFQACDA